MAALITTEMGKPLAEAAAELEKSAVTADYYADQAEAILGDEAVPIDGVDVWISYEPIGLVLGGNALELPRVAGDAVRNLSITAGNGVLLKHSPNVTGSALALQQLCVAAGLPEHLPHRPGRRRAGRPGGHRLADRRRPDRGRDPDRLQSGYAAVGAAAGRGLEEVGTGTRRLRRLRRPR